MNRKDIIPLFFIILTILLISVLIGDLIISPIVLYHMFLVRFFGTFFLLLAVFLLSMKLYANYSFLVLHHTGPKVFFVLIQKTISETRKQLFSKIGNFFLFLVFLIIIGSITVFVIWLNGNIIKIQAS